MAVVKDHRVQGITPTFFFIIIPKHLGGTAVFETEY